MAAAPRMLGRLAPDVAHFTNGMMPLASPVPTVVTIHDMASLLFERRSDRQSPPDMVVAPFERNSIVRKLAAEMTLRNLVHEPDLAHKDFLARANTYSSLAAREWAAGGRRARISDLVTRPLGRFLSMYVARAGFLDGWRGFLLAVLYAYYVFMRSAKALEKVRISS